MAGIMTINSDLDPAALFVRQSIAQAREKNAAINEENREKLDDFYHGRQMKPQYLKNYGFDDVNLPLHSINLTKKIIDKISLVYKNRPDRKIGESDKYTDFINENLRLVIAFKRAERLKNLFGNVLFRPMWYNGRFHFWIETEFIPYFLDGDPLTPIAYSIPVKRDTTITEKNKIEEKQWYMYWSNEYYYWHDTDGNIKYDPNYPDGRNPFGLMPFVEIRTDDPLNEYWPEGAIDLVQANMSINVMLNNLNYIAHFQAFNQPYGVGIQQEDAESIKIGANHFIGLSQPDMDLRLLNYSPQIAQLVDMIKAQVEFVSQMYNVNIQWSLDGTPPSGFSLVVRNIDLLEAREDSVEYAQMYEQQVYDVIQRQDKVLKLGYGLPERTKETKLIVDFHEISFPVSAAEETGKWTWKFDNNIATPVDYIQADQNLTEDDAQERYNQNKEVNQKLTIREQVLANEIKAQGALVK